MAKRIFREKALARLSSPEQLDQLIQVTSPRSWLVLLSLFVLLATFVTWGVVGRVSTRVQGRGIILGGSVYEVVPMSGGQVFRLLVELGAEIEAGDLVAEIDQPELLREIEDARARLAELREERDYIRSIGTREIEIQRAYVAGQKDNLVENIEEHEEMVELLTKQLVRERDLLEKQLIAAEELLPTQQTLNETRDRLVRAQSELTRLRSDELNTEFAVQQRLIASDQRVHEAERSVGQLENDHRLRSMVISPYAGRVLERTVDEGSLISPGQPLVKLSLSDRAEPLHVVLYVNGEDGKRIENGMPVQIAPATVKPEEWGYMMGTVASVAEFPSTTPGMQNVLKNDQLVGQLSSLGSPFQVDVRLSPRRDADSGFAWTSGPGPDVEIKDGTPATGLIIVEKRRPIELIVPGLKKRLSLL